MPEQQKNESLEPADQLLTNSERLKIKKEGPKKLGKGRKILMGLGLAAGVTAVANLFPAVRGYEEDGLSQIGDYLTSGPTTIESHFPKVFTTNDFAPIEQSQPTEQSIDVNAKQVIMGFPFDSETINGANTIRYTIEDKVLNDTTKEPSHIYKFTGLPKGTRIYSPIEGGVFKFETAGEMTPINLPAAYTLLSLRFVDEAGNHGIMTIGVLGGKDLIDIPPLPGGRPPDGSGLQVKQFQPLLEINTDNLEPQAGQHIPSNFDGQVVIQVSYDEGKVSLTPLQIDFQKLIDGKIAVPSGQTLR